MLAHPFPSWWARMLLAALWQLARSRCTLAVAPSKRERVTLSVASYRHHGACASFSSMLRSHVISGMRHRTAATSKKQKVHTHSCFWCQASDPLFHQPSPLRCLCTIFLHAEPACYQRRALPQWWRGAVEVVHHGTGKCYFAHP